MKVLMLTRLYKPHIGGVERHIEEIAKILNNRNFETTIISENYNQKLKAKEIFNGTKIYRFRYPHIKFLGLVYIWGWLLKNIKLLKEADIIHIHDVFIWYFPFKILFPKKPVYITFHGYSSYPIKRKSILIRKLAEKMVNGNIIVGSFMKKWYGTKNSTVIYGGVDLKKFRSKRKKKYKYNAVFSSRLDKQTGILTYIDTVKILLRKGINFKLVVLGDGEKRSTVKNWAISKGFVSDPSPYFKEAQFAFVSRYLAILEAFASRKLVFAVYDNPLKKDYLTMTPFAKWMIIEKSPEKLAQKVEYYLKNPKKGKDKVEKAYQWVTSKTWENVAKEYLKMWGKK